MRWFMDTEFNENGRTIDLISIALVCEDGRELYFAIDDGDGWQSTACNAWVVENVLPKLPPPEQRVSREYARQQIIAALTPTSLSDHLEIWAYFADYDWVVFAQLFGTMMDLPNGFPMFCMDLNQEIILREFDPTQLPEQPAVEHNALEDARWVRAAWQEIGVRNV